MEKSLSVKWQQINQNKYIFSGVWFKICNNHGYKQSRIKPGLRCLHSEAYLVSLNITSLVC